MAFISPPPSPSLSALTIPKPSFSELTALILRCGEISHPNDYAQSIQLFAERLCFYRYPVAYILGMMSRSYYSHIALSIGALR